MGGSGCPAATLCSAWIVRRTPLEAALNTPLLVTPPAMPQGRVLIPLQEVVRKRRMRGSWPLQDAEGGHLTMELGWQAAAASVFGGGQ